MALVFALVFGIGRPLELQSPPNTSVRVGSHGWKEQARGNLAQHGYVHVLGLLNRTEAQQLRDVAHDYCYGPERKALPLSWGGYSVPAFLNLPDFAAASWLLDDPRLHELLAAVFDKKTGYRYASHNDVGCDFVGVWHKDILRGPVKKYQIHDMWTPDEHGEQHEIYKVMFYLQDHDNDDLSMKVIPGSHISRDMSLEKGFATLHPQLGDAVVFDQRISHRGNSYYNPFRSARIFMQLGFGKDNQFTDEFEAGTKVRQDGYQRKMLGSSVRRGYQTLLADMKFAFLGIVTAGIPPTVMNSIVDVDIKKYPLLGRVIFGSNAAAAKPA